MNNLLLGIMVVSTMLVAGLTVTAWVMDDASATADDGAIPIDCPEGYSPTATGVPDVKVVKTTINWCNVQWSGLHPTSTVDPDDDRERV